MNKEFAKEWVKALRSGEFTQTTNSLQDGSGFCCLGVACRIAGDAGLVKLDMWRSNGKLAGTTFESNKDMFDITGIDQEFHDWLIAMNDKNGSSFSRIANVIERKAGLNTF